MAGPKMKLSLHLEVPEPMTRNASFQFGDEGDEGIASFSFLSSTSDGERPEQMKILPIGEHGFTLRDFTLGPELGRGEGGGVRIAAHRPSKIRYALKEISIGAQATRHQLGKELQMQRNCRFPHIVQLYDVFYDEGRVYLVLELMDWGSLERLLQAQQQQQDPSRKGMDEGVLGVVMHRIMCAVSYLQTEHKIIHRDLKPGNVVMSCNGNVKLSDFGVSRVLDNDAKGLSWVGTASYMSPERLQGGEYSHKADVWSLGIISLECALGQHPYMPSEGQLAFFELMQVVVVDPAPIPMNRGLSPEFVEFASLCLAKPERKRRSAQELLQHPFLLLHVNKGEDLVRQWLALFPKPAIEEGFADSAFGGVGAELLPDCEIQDPMGIDS